MASGSSLWLLADESTVAWWPLARGRVRARHADGQEVVHDSGSNRRADVLPNDLSSQAPLSACAAYWVVLETVESFGSPCSQSHAGAAKHRVRWSSLFWRDHFLMFHMPMWPFVRKRIGA